jgi:hypothetical protein
MATRFNCGDLVVVRADVTPINFEFPHVMRGDIVKVVEIVPRKVIRDMSPDAPRVWCDCDIEAADGTIWPAGFFALERLHVRDRGSWTEILNQTGWAPPPFKRRIERRRSQHGN